MLSAISNHGVIGNHLNHANIFAVTYLFLMSLVLFFSLYKSETTLQGIPTAHKNSVKKKVHRKRLGESQTSPN